MKELTPRQAEVLETIRNHLIEHQALPTLMDLCAHFNWASQEAAVRHMEALEKKGYIERTGRKVSHWYRLTNTRVELHDPPS